MRISQHHPPFLVPFLREISNHDAGTADPERGHPGRSSFEHRLSLKDLERSVKPGTAAARMAGLRVMGMRLFN